MSEPTFTPPPLSPDLKDRILESVRSTPSPTRSVTRTLHLVLALVAAAGVLVTFFLWGDGHVHHAGPGYGFREWGWPRTAPLIVLTFLGAVGATAACWWLAVRRRSMMSPPARLLAWTAIGTVVALFAWKFGVTAAFGELGLTLDRAGFKCLGLGTTMGLFPLAALLWTHRRSEPNHPILTGMIYGVASGTISWVMLELWCPASFFVHLLRGHVGPIVNLAVLGGIAGSLMLSLAPYRGRTSPN